MDRFYIERFLGASSSSIRGRVLEVGEDRYTRRFGGDRVARSDVLHVADGHQGATIIGDLSRKGALPEKSFDCVIVTQTLQLIYDVRAAIGNLHAALKPRGTALITVPGISQISRADMDRWGHYWSFTTRSLELLCQEFFPADGVEVRSHGNVLAATAFLYGIAQEELTQGELEFEDRDYQLLITARAIRAVEED